MAQRAQIAFLRSIFGVGALAEQVPRQRIDVVQIGQRRVVKTPRLVKIIAASGTRHDVTLGFPGYRQALSLRSIEHHCAALPPVAVSTTMAPVMCGCRE